MSTTNVKPSAHTFPHRPEYQYHITNFTNGASASFFTLPKHCTYNSNLEVTYVDMTGIVMYVSRKEAARAIRKMRTNADVTVSRMLGVGYDIPSTHYYHATYCPLPTRSA